MPRDDPEAYTKKRLVPSVLFPHHLSSTPSEGMEYPLSQVKSDSEGQGSITTTLGETSVDMLFTAEPEMSTSTRRAAATRPG